MNTAYHQKSEKPHGNALWTRERMEAIMVDVRAKMKRPDVAKKHGITTKLLSQKITAYNAGELK